MSEKSSVSKVRSAAREAAGERLSKRRTELRRVLSHDLTDRRTRTRAKLLVAGRELVVERGIGATSVGDICSRAGFTRGAFYSNFSDMDHFIQELAAGVWGELEADLREAVAGQVNNEAAVTDLHNVEAESNLLQDSKAATTRPVSADLTTLTHSLRAAMPMSRDFYFLQNELVMHTIRGEYTDALRAAYQSFRASMVELVRVGYARIGRVCLLPAEDMTDLLFGLTERSMRQALLAGDDGEGSSDNAPLAKLFDDALPQVLLSLSKPA